MTLATIPCMMPHRLDSILILMLNLIMSASNNCANLSCFAMISGVQLRQRRLLAQPRCIFATLIQQCLSWITSMAQLFCSCGQHRIRCFFR